MLDQTISILRELIAFDTTSRNTNLALIEYIADHLEQKGFDIELTYNQDQSEGNPAKANLFATLKAATGSSDQAGLVLSGHTDVVPVDGQHWSSDPFQAEIRGDKLFGRGSCDMKGFIAVCLAMADTFKAAELPMPIHMAFSYDEEVGCIGVRGLLDELAQRAVKPLACIVGEPTSMQVVRAHKGMLAKRCKITGCAGHSSLPDEGVNAIYQATRLIGKLNEIEAEIKSNGPFDNHFTPPYTSVHVGTIQGGTAMNIIPEHCEFDFEFRNLPDEDPDHYFQTLKSYADGTLLPTMKAVSTAAEINWQQLAAYPGLDTPEEAKITQWAAGLLRSDPVKSTDPASGVSYGTEAGLFSDIGIPTIVCGPGSIEQAHRPDEFVALSELEGCIEFMQDLTDSLKQAQLI